MRHAYLTKIGISYPLCPVPLIHDPENHVDLVQALQSHPLAVLESITCVLCRNRVIDLYVALFHNKPKHTRKYRGEPRKQEKISTAVRTRDIWRARALR